MSSADSSSDEGWEKVGRAEVNAASSACAVEEAAASAFQASETMPAAVSDQQPSDITCGSQAAGLVMRAAAPDEPHHPAQAPSESEQLGDQQLQPNLNRAAKGQQGAAVVEGTGAASEGEQLRVQPLQADQNEAAKGQQHAGVGEGTGAASEDEQLRDQQLQPDQSKASKHQQHAAVVEGTGTTGTATVRPEASSDQGPASAQGAWTSEGSLDVARSLDLQPRLVTLKEAAAVPLPAASAAAAKRDSDSHECWRDLGQVSQMQHSRLAGASFAEKHAALTEALTALRPTLGQQLGKQLQQQLLSPTILALGPPSSGKSSLLESLSRCPIFPHDSRLGSILPIRLQTSPCGKDDQRLYEVTFNQESYIMFRMEEVRPQVTSILERVAASSQPTNSELGVVVSEPGLRHLNLVDLPSIAHGSPAHQEVVWGIAKTYLAQPGTVALCVSSAVSPFHWRPVDATPGKDSPAKRSSSMKDPGKSEASASKRGSEREPGAAKSGNRAKPRVGSGSWVRAMVDEVASRKTSISVITMADLAPHGLLQPSLFGSPCAADAALEVVSGPCQNDASSKCSSSTGNTNSDAEPDSPSSSAAGMNSQHRGPDKWAGIPKAEPVQEGQCQDQLARCAVISGKHAASDAQQSFAESEELEASLFRNMLGATGLKPVGSWEDLALEQPSASLRCSPEQQKLRTQQLKRIAGRLGMQNLHRQIARAEGLAANEVREAMYASLQKASAEGRLVLKALFSDPASLHVPTFLANLSHSISHEAVFSAVMKCPIVTRCPDVIPVLLQDHRQLYADLFTAPTHPTTATTLTPPMTLKDLERAWEGVMLAQLPQAQLRNILSALLDDMDRSIKLWLGEVGGVHAAPRYMLHVQELIFSDLVQSDPLLREYPVLSVTMKRRLQEQIEVPTIAASVLSMLDPLLMSLRRGLDGSAAESGDLATETGDLDSLIHVATAQAVYSAFLDGLVTRLLPEDFVLKEAGSAAEKRRPANVSLQAACKATVALRSFGDSFGFREGFAQQLPEATPANSQAASSRPQAGAEPSATSASQDGSAQESTTTLQSSQPEPVAAEVWASPIRASLYVFNAAWPTPAAPKGSWQLQVEPAAYTFIKRNPAWPNASGSPGWFLSLSDCFKAEISTCKEDGFIFDDQANLVVFRACEHELQTKVCALHFQSQTAYQGFVKQHEAREFENATSMQYSDDLLLGLDNGQNDDEHLNLEAADRAAEETTIFNYEDEEEDEGASEEEEEESD